MLEADSNRLSVEGLKLYLDHPDVMVRLYDSVPSTNQAAKLAAVSGDAGHGSLVAALEQTEGRGRRGRSFCSPREAGLYFSVVLHPGESLQESLLITTAAAVAVYKAVLEVCGISLGIKWVNDLFKDGKKVCGILTEAMTDFESGNIESAIVGIGLNLFPGEEIPEELENIAGALYDTEEEAGRADRNRPGGTDRKSSAEGNRGSIPFASVYTAEFYFGKGNTDSGFWKSSESYCDGYMPGWQTSSEGG